MSDTATAPASSGSSDAPVTLASVAPTLAEQLYTTPPVTAPVVDTTPADATKPADAPVVDDGPEFVQDEQGKWHRADGTFATADELAQIDAQLAESDKANKDAEANRPATTVAIRGRNGETVEIEAPDEATAQLLRQNVNDGLRHREYTTKMAEVEAKMAELQHVGQMLQANPEGLLDAMPDDVQIRILTRGLARHFDALIPVIQGYDTNPSTRIAAVAETQRAMREQQGQYDNLVTSQRAASEVKQAVASLIPDTADESILPEFWNLATLKLVAAVDAQQPVNKETVKAILAPVLKLYGFEGAAPAAPTKPRITLAKVNTPAAPAAGVQQNQQNQQRLRLVQQQRRNAAAIPPHGRGGPAKPALSPTESAFQNAAHLLYGGTSRA